MINNAGRRAWWLAVGPRPERRVRHSHDGPRALRRFGIFLVKRHSRNPLLRRKCSQAVRTVRKAVGGREPRSGCSRSACWTREARPLGRVVLKQDADARKRCLTFELRRDRRRDARPDGCMIDKGGRRAWWLAVGPRLERRVRHCFGGWQWLVIFGYLHIRDQRALPAPAQAAPA